MRASLTLALLGVLGACLDDRDLVPATVDEDPQLPRLVAGETALHVSEAGAPGAPLVVFVHGGPGANHRGFLGWRRLADAGYHVVLYDQRGAGLSRRHDAAELDLARALADLGAVIAAHTSAAEPVVLFAHSWGAMLATAYLDQDPAALAGAVLVEPGGFTRAEVEDFFTRAVGALEVDEGTSDVLWTAEHLSADDHARWDYLTAANALSGEGPEGNDPARPTPFWRWGGAVSYHLPRAIAAGGDFDWTTRLDEVAFPVLWFRSEKNRVTGEAQQLALAAHYPLVEMHVVAGVGHDLVFQRQAELEPVVLDYLARVTQVTPP